MNAAKSAEIIYLPPNVVSSENFSYTFLNRGREGFLYMHIHFKGLDLPWKSP